MRGEANDRPVSSLRASGSSSKSAGAISTMTSIPSARDGDPSWMSSACRDLPDPVVQGRARRTDDQVPEVAEALDSKALQLQRSPVPSDGALIPRSNTA